MREVFMGSDLICAWLQIPVGNWPPDHYTLLGLQPGEADVARIEQQVHERMQNVRVYQLTHPDLATEAMNRLAQAMICLCDPRAKQTYDQGLFPDRFVAEPPPVSKAPLHRQGHSLAWLFGRSNPDAEEPRPAGPKTLVDWETTPPPQRLRTEPEIPAVAENVPKTPEQTPSQPAPSSAGNDTLVAKEAVPVSAPLEPLGGRVANQANWRKGLGTRRALHYRMLWHRQLWWAWKRVGKYLNRPARALHRPAEATDLIHHMQSIRELLGVLPIIGEAGQPGYLVMALACQQMIVPTLQTLLPSQRQALARDWQAGLEELNTHRQFLRQELRALRRRGYWRQVLRALRTVVVEHAGIVVLLIAGVALDVKYDWAWQTWPKQLVCLLAIIAVRIAFVKLSRPHVPNRRELPAPANMPPRKAARRPRKLPNSSRA
jgi:hypothetical protein